MKTKFHQIRTLRPDVNIPIGAAGKAISSARNADLPIIAHGMFMGGGSFLPGFFKPDTKGN